jgi:transcriptional regulator
MSAGVATNRPGMTLSQCAKVLHCSRANVWYTEQHALAKLRARPESLKALVDLANELDRNRRADYTVVRR